MAARPDSLRQFRPGDRVELPAGVVLSTPILGGRHLGIATGETRDGRPVVIHNSKSRWRRVTEEPITGDDGFSDYYATAQGREPYPIHVEGYWSALPPEAVVARARSRIGEKWRFWDWNCEHFVQWACGRPARSPQVEAWLGAAALLGVLGHAWGLAGRTVVPLGERKKIKGRFCERRVAPASAFDRRSFRWKRSGSAWVLVGCPRGEWDPRATIVVRGRRVRGRCRVGTRAHRVLSPAPARGACRKGKG